MRVINWNTLVASTRTGNEREVEYEFSGGRRFYRQPRAKHGYSVVFDDSFKYPDPITGLLFYLDTPNSDNHPWVESDEWDEDDKYWGYELPDTTEMRAATGWRLGVRNSFFDELGAPITVWATELVLDPTINTSNILFKLTSVENKTGKLAVYVKGTSPLILDKAKQALRI